MNEPTKRMQRARFLAAIFAVGGLATCSTAAERAESEVAQALGGGDGGSGSDGGGGEPGSDGGGSGSDAGFDAPGSDGGGSGSDAPPEGPGSDGGGGSDAPTEGPGSDGGGSGSDGGVDGPGSDGPGPGSDGGGPGSDGGVDGPGSDGPGPGSDGGMDGPGSDGPGPGSDGGTNGIDILQSMITLAPMGAVGIADVVSLGPATTNLVLATLDDPDNAFTFTTAGCANDQCTVNTPLPTVLGIQCTASAGSSHTGRLTVRGNNGAMDVADLLCAQSGGPLIDVAPPTLDAGDVPVNMAKDLAFTVTNNGTSALSFGASLLAVPEWTAPDAACLAPAMCSVAPGGGSATVGVRFAPVAPGPSVSAVTVASSAGNRTVDLVGTGVGARVVVTDPASFDIDFGIIPRNAQPSRTISVSAIGNRAVTLQAATPSPPFTVTPASHLLSPGTPQQFTVQCSAPAATAPSTQSIALTSANAYAVAPAAVSVRCRVADTQLAVMPSTFDFMERRKGDADPTLTFTISNPGPQAATVASVALANAPDALSLEVAGGAFPRTLAAGETITGSLTLDTINDLDLADVAAELGIEVDGERLELPIIGKVTTPAAYVTPEKLDLGTACSGTQVSAVVELVNSGTAQLTMDEPVMDASFTARYESPTQYPSPLLAGTRATIAVSPAAQGPGEIAATLSWGVDAPDAPFTVPVSLSYIDSGTAVSPANLNFSAVNIREVSSRYTVTLENCNPTPAVVTVDGVVPSRGGIDAWDVQPRFEQRTLAPRGKMRVLVAFVPKRHGRHVAQLKIEIDGELRFVTLEGDGIDANFKRTSFYACACDSPGAPGGWAFAVAAGVGVIVLRRRRRISAPRPSGSS